MKLFLSGAIFFLACFQAASAIYCLQGAERILPNGKVVQLGNFNRPECTECSFLSAGKSALMLLELKPQTVTMPSFSYKCFHLRIKNYETKSTSVVKGCIYKHQNVCSGKYHQEHVVEMFCNQCDQGECHLSTVSSGTEVAHIQSAKKKEL